MTSLRDIMTSDVMAVSPETSLREVASLLVSEHISGVPVVAGGKVEGVVSATDLLEFDASSPGSPGGREDWGAASPLDEWERAEEAPASYFTDMWENAGADVVERFERSGGPEWNVLEEHVASEVMTRTLVSLPPDTPVQEAARTMLEAEVRRVLVIDDGELVGVATAGDVLRAVAEGKIGS